MLGQHCERGALGGSQLQALASSCKNEATTGKLQQFDSYMEPILTELAQQTQKKIRAHITTVVETMEKLGKDTAIQSMETILDGEDHTALVERC